MGRPKYYVVWEGRTTGVFDNWAICKAQVEGYPTAKYKSFDSRDEAQLAFRDPYEKHIAVAKKTPSAAKNANGAGSIIYPSICVDAACSGNPGDMEYRGVDTATHREIFKMGVFRQGTNNIGEFLGIVHGLAWLQQKGSAVPIYSDSLTAISWVRKKKANTKLEATAENKKLFELIARAELWLANNTFKNPIIKWETDVWGEIPADFGRK